MDGRRSRKSTSVVDANQDAEGRRSRKSTSAMDNTGSKGMAVKPPRRRKMKRKEESEDRGQPAKKFDFDPATMTAVDPLAPHPQTNYDKWATKVQKVRDEEKGKAFKLFMALLLSVFMTGPIVCLFIHQVCVSRCIVMRRFPRPLNPEVDDVLIILLFLFFLFINFTFICVVYSFFRQAIRAIYIKLVVLMGYRPSMPVYVEAWILMDKTMLKRPVKEVSVLLNV